MSFVEFARGHGLLVANVAADNCWHRVRTADKPRSLNGAYKFDGKSGIVQNWAKMDKCAYWPTTGVVRQRARQTPAEEDKSKFAAQVAKKMLEEARLSGHDYLNKKGFKEFVGLVRDEELLIPMRDFESRELTSIQKIKPCGEKRFLAGSRTKNAVFVINRKALHLGAWLTEGFATGLSVSETLKDSWWNLSVVVCFSANNLSRVAKQIKKCFVFADADEAGLRAAKESGHPFVRGEDGEDANDIYLRSKPELRKLVLSMRRR